MSTTARLLDAIDGRFGRDNAPSRIGIAVSGGSDSMALLHLLADWGRADLAAVTVDHGLRPEAQEEAATVAEICGQLNVPHDTVRWQGWDGKGNLQDHARRNRYSLMAEWAGRNDRQIVVLGHTMDDQAETFLMRLAREAGVDGLSGMAGAFSRNGMKFERPMLNLRRQDLRDYLTEKGVTWIDDPSNEDDRFDRIKARKVLAAMEPLGIDPESITMSMLNLEFARMALSQEAFEKARGFCKSASGDLIFDRTKLRGCPTEILRRLLAGALKWVSSAEYPPRRAPLSDVEAAIFSGTNASLHGCLISVSDMTVRITREFNAVEKSRSRTTAMWDRRWRLSGPHADDLEIRPLGDALGQCPDWRGTGLPRQTLLATPAIWRGDVLVAAPVAGLENGWSADVTGRDDFAASLLSR